MLSGRPLLYMSLPGVAFILGVFWFRRRNKNRFEIDRSNAIAGEDDHISSNNQKVLKEEANGNIKSITTSSTASKSISINGTISNDDENRVFGKSAPIKIVQNGRGASPVKQCQKQIDSDVLKSKIQDAERKLLKSIDEDFENLSSPVDLPDSFNNRMSFYSRTVDINKDKPVVIMATTTPKISPKNSFMERNNNFDSSDGQMKNSPLIHAAPALSTAETSTNYDNDAEDADAEKSIVVDTTEAETTIANEKRNVDAASPSLSLCSVQSGDSGKGSSLPRSEAARAKVTYEFFLPNSLVGQLYGRKRLFIAFIKTKTNASVVLRQKIYTGKLRVCAVEGTESEIQAALALIRQRLPVKRYPNLTMQRIHFALPQTVVPLSTESLLNLQLNLIEGINNDVVVSAVISGGHIFVQHPLHPTHPSLTILQKCLYDSYTTVEAPLLPGIELSAVCVMPVNGVWYRVQIVDQDAEEADRCIVKFLDFGGYMNVHFNELRQIRSDFMSIPFQATECILSNIEPTDTCWSADSANVLSKLTKGIVLQAQVAGYNSQNMPEIYLFACLGPNKVIKKKALSAVMIIYHHMLYSIAFEEAIETVFVKRNVKHDYWQDEGGRRENEACLLACTLNVIFINKELVARNLAKWVELRD